MSARWFALQSKPHKEAALLSHLEAEGVEAWFPSYRVKPVNPRSRTVRALYPRYLFVRVDPAEWPASRFQCALRQQDQRRASR